MMMPSSGLTLGNSCGRRNALLLLWLYIRTAWMKLKPTSGALISTIDHSARLTSSSRTSLANSSQVSRSSRTATRPSSRSVRLPAESTFTDTRRALATDGGSSASASGERKEDLLEAAARQPCFGAQLVERAHADYAALRQQQHAVADALRVHQLVNAQEQRARLRAQVAQDRHHRSRLLQIETVKWLIQREEWLGRHQRQRDQQALHIALRERIDALAQHGLQGQLVEDDALPAPGVHVVHATEEREHFDRVQLGVWRYVVRQIEHEALRVPVRRRIVADVEGASGARPQTRQTLHQGGLAGAIRTDP